MSNWDGVPEAVVSCVERGVADEVFDPERVSRVKKIRLAESDEVPSSYDGDEDVYYYEIRAADFDIGYNKVYYGVVYYDGGAARREKLGNWNV